ncbi:MAG: hypothetical protein M1840_008662 [Geoglossum simile]|nr:MAG: hypothetical protein M1840_008662 [Geoglossum simile]
MTRPGAVAHRHPRALTESSCSLCTTTALSAASCSGSGDDLCSCPTTAYGYHLSSCMASQESLGCVPSDWASASSSISASCSYWTESLGSSFCKECTTSAIASVGCVDYNDYSCLCGASSSYVDAFSQCAAGTYSFGAKCPFKTSMYLMSSYTSSCSSYSSSISAFPPGCPGCQAEAADKVSCSGRFDFKCICTRSTYVLLLSSCISSRCSDSDFSIARSSYTDACSVVATGGTPTAAAASFTGKSNSGAFPSETGAGKSGSTTHGPKVGMIAAVAGGVVFLIAALVIGGFFLFRRKRNNSAEPPSADSVPLQPTSGSSPPPDYKASTYPQEADGVAVPGHPGYTPPPLPPGRYEAPASDTGSPSPAWQAQGYMVNEYNKPPGAYVELGGGAHVPPPTPPQPYPQYQYQQQQQPYQRPIPGGGGSGPIFELGGPGR